MVVDAFKFEGFCDHLHVKSSVPFDLCKVTGTSHESQPDAWRTSASLGDLLNSVCRDFVDSKASKCPLQNFNQFIVLVVVDSM